MTMEKVQNIMTLFKFFTYLILSPKSSFRKVEMQEVLAKLIKAEDKSGESFIENVIKLGFVKRIDRIEYALSEEGYQLWVELNQDIKANNEMSAKKNGWIQEVISIIEN